MKTKLLGLVVGAVFIAGLTSCGDDDGVIDNPPLEVPSTYNFLRNGESSVFFGGQTDRLNMVGEIKDLTKTGDAGNAIDPGRLSNMFDNQNDPFESAVLNSSTRRLENKTFAADIQFFRDLIVEAGTNSAAIAVNPVTAAQGVPGLLDRNGNGRTILVNEKGWEYTQFFEKGLMGSVFYNQIYNVYLSDARTGDDVENVSLEEGTNYTPLEHGWDEAFGYFGVPLDFPAGDPILEDAEDRFWAQYTFDLSADNLIPEINNTIMNAYLTGRAAIVANNLEVKNQQREILREWHEIVAAGTTIHYINNTLDDLGNSDIPNAFHHLSEGYNFLKAVQYNPNKKLTQAEINEILTSDFGTDGDFWTVTPAGLNKAKATIASKYPELSPIQDLL